MSKWEYRKLKELPDNTMFITYWNKIYDDCKLIYTGLGSAYVCNYGDGGRMEHWSLETKVLLLVNRAGEPVTPI